MKNEKFKQICHFFAGIILLPVAFKLFEQKKFIPCLILLFAGMFFIFVSATFEWVEKSIGNVTKLIFLVECFVFFYTTYLQLEAGKKTPTLAFASAGIVYLLIFLYYLYGKEKNRKHKHRHKSHRKHHSIDDEEGNQKNGSKETID